MYKLYSTYVYKQYNCTEYHEDIFWNLSITKYFLSFEQLIILKTIWHSLHKSKQIAGENIFSKLITKFVRFWEPGPSWTKLNIHTFELFFMNIQIPTCVRHSWHIKTYFLSWVSHVTNIKFWLARRVSDSRLNNVNSYFWIVFHEYPNSHMCQAFLTHQIYLLSWVFSRNKQQVLTC